MNISHWYFGDGVYATAHDNGELVLTTGHHEVHRAQNVIHLEPGMLTRIQKWIDAGAPDNNTGRPLVPRPPEPNFPDFYVDQSQPGVIRGGVFVGSDDMAGMLVGMRAKQICDLLNAGLRAGPPTPT